MVPAPPGQAVAWLCPENERVVGATGPQLPEVCVSVSRYVPDMGGMHPFSLTVMPDEPPPPLLPHEISSSSTGNAGVLDMVGAGYSRDPRLAPGSRMAHPAGAPVLHFRSLAGGTGIALQGSSAEVV